MFGSQQVWRRWSFGVFTEEPDGGGGGTGDDVVKKAAFERDRAVAEQAKLRRELDELKRGLPTDEQKAKWAALEKAEETAEEERKRKAGEFDGWRTQIAEKHGKELERERKLTADEKAKAESTETELRETLIGLAFSGASKLFGANGTTVLLPEVAQSYFGKHVKVLTDEKTGKRSVVVHDQAGTPIVDPKTGTPLAFEAALKEIIDAHPAKDSLLRGSGKVGSGSAGGANGSPETVDLTRLSRSDFSNPKVREAVKNQFANAGGMQIGPAFDRRTEK